MLAVLALSAVLAVGCVLAAIVLFATGTIGAGLATVVGAIVFALMARSLFKQLQQPS